MNKPQIFKSKEEAPKEAKLVDAYKSSLEELFFINNPNLKNNTPGVREAMEKYLRENNFPDIWIYYPWHKLLIRTVDEETYFKMRTARNRNVITKEEQQEYRNIKVGIAGLSVGSAVLSALVMSGGPRVMKIADFDTVEISNLNRIKAKLKDIGSNKTHIAAREVWDLDPFADLHLWDSGINENNLKDFIAGEPVLDIFIDEMDNLALKIISRLICRDLKVPVIMATDNGDNVILDVERFDLEPNRPIFHGLIEDMKPEELKNLDFQKWLSLATKIVGPEYLTERMKQSLSEIGKTIPSVPQLGTTASIAGSAAAYAIRKIANKQLMPSGRYIIDFESRLANAV